MTKKDQVLAYLQTHEYITALVAIGVFGLYRLAVTIASLRAKGYSIRTEIRLDELGRRYARYYLDQSE